MAANVAEPLVAMLASESESTRLAALKTMPGLVNRAGPVLRLQMGTADTVEALWRLIQSKTETTPPTEEAIAAAKEADEDPPEPVETVIPPPTPQLYYALRVLNAMVFADWQCTYFVIGRGGSRKSSHPIHRLPHPTVTKPSRVFTRPRCTHHPAPPNQIKTCLAKVLAA